MTRNTVLPILAALAALPSPAAAQQVVELPSLTEMMRNAQPVERDDGDARPRKAPRQSRTAEKAMAAEDRQRDAEDQAQRRRQEQQAREVDDQAKRAQDERRRTEDRIIRAIRESSKGPYSPNWKKSKPLKRVRTLPPNASRY